MPPTNIVTLLQQKLRDVTVDIELKDNSVVSGTVVSMDSLMNMDLKDVKVVSKGKNPESYATHYLRGDKIRFIRLDEVDSKLLTAAAPK